MKALCALAAHDLRRKTCEDMVPSAGQVAIGMRGGRISGLSDPCLNLRFYGSAELFLCLRAALRETLVADDTPLIIHTFPLSESDTAFAIASDQSKAMKVQLEFS